MKKDEPPKDEGQTRFALALRVHGISVEQAARIMGVEKDTIRAYCAGRRSIERASLGSVLRLCLEKGINLDEMLDRRDLWPKDRPDLDGLESAASRVEKRIAGLFEDIEKIQDGQREIRDQQQRTQERVTNLSERVARLEDDGPPPQGRKRRA